MRSRDIRTDVVLFLGLAVLPLAAAGLFLFIISAQRRERYNPAYFTPEYIEKYAEIGGATNALKQALVTGDQRLYEELSGMQQPPQLPEVELEEVRFLRLNPEEPRYREMLYYDFETGRRTTQYLSEVDGRWVVSPRDAYFYMQSGRWQLVWLPVALGWWLSLLGVILVTALWHIAHRWRRSIFG